MDDPLIQKIFIKSVLKTSGKSYCDKSVTSPPPLFEFNVLFEWPLVAKNLKKITGLLLKKRRHLLCSKINWNSRNFNCSEKKHLKLFSFIFVITQMFTSLKQCFNFIQNVLFSVIFYV